MADTPVTVTPTGAAAAVEAVTRPDNTVEATVAKNATSEADPRDAIYARKERQLRKMQQAMAEEKKTLMAKIAEYETGYIPKARLKQDLWGVLGEEGYDYNTLTEQMLSQPNMNDPATRALMAKLKQLEDKQNAAERQAQESTQAQYAQAIKQISSEVRMVVDSNPEYESIKETGMQDAVVELIEQTFNSKGYLMDIEAAAKEVEAHLLAEAEKFTKLKKLQKPSAEQQTQATAPQTQAKQPIKTLTNAVTMQSGRSREQEKRARAIAAFEGKLKG